MKHPPQTSTYWLNILDVSHNISLNTEITFLKPTFTNHLQRLLRYHLRKIFKNSHLNVFREKVFGALKITIKGFLPTSWIFPYYGNKSSTDFYNNFFQNS